MSTPIRLAVRWTVAAGQTQAMTDALQSVMLDARRQPGCVTCSMSAQASDRVTVLFEEVWATEQHLRAHVGSAGFGRLAELVEQALEPPAIEVVLPGGTRGLDYLQPPG